MANTIRDFDAAIRALEVVKPEFKLATCGWVLGPKSDRALFDKYLPKSVAFSCINRNLGWEPVDTAFVRINGREKWAIPWLEDDPGMTIPQLWVGRMRRDAADAYAYGCNGYFGIHWRTRGLSMNVSALAKAAWEQPWNQRTGIRITPDKLKSYLSSQEGSNRNNRDLECLDFYRDWCRIQFGASVSQKLADIFVGLDGVRQKSVKLEANLSRLPRPATWDNGPGNILMNYHPWDSVKIQYDFVDKIEQLRPSVTGKGNLERFDYWLNQFKYLRSMGQLACSVGLFKIGTMEMEKVKESEKRQYAKEKLVPLPKKEADQLCNVQKYLVSTLSTWGELGTLCNWQQHVIPSYLNPQIKVIAGIMGDSTWVPSAFPDKLDIKKIIVPSPQSIIQNNSDYQVKVLTFNVHPKKAILYWRFLGEKVFRQYPLTNNEGEYLVGTIPASEIKDDFEYYIYISDNQDYRYPVTAPYLNFAVTRM